MSPPILHHRADAHTANPQLAKRRADYLRWHHAQVQTGDIDPVYPVLRALADEWQLTHEERLWLCVLHVVWYHPGSTLTAFDVAPTLRELPATPEHLAHAGLTTLPTGTERRGHRATPPLVRHLLALPRVFDGGIAPWVDDTIAPYAGEPTLAWEALNNHLDAVPGNGRWAAYKLAEMWQKVADVPVQAANAGHKYSSGPRKGLADLYPRRVTLDDQSPYALARLDRLTDDLARQLGESDIALVETSLCDFHSLVSGHYYLGHDIDAMQEAWSHPRVARHIPPDAWEARHAAFPHHLLGELRGWQGIRRDRTRAYRDSGELIGVPK
jgi:hypothetical protein